MANQVIVTNTGNVQVALETTPNVQVQISRAAIGTVSNVPTANFANYAGNVTVAAQPNITSLGTLTGLTVNGTANVTNLNVSGNLSVGNLVANTANYANFAGVAYSVSGSNVVGAVANATYANSANTANSATVAGSANSVALANVSGAGNIASINLDGNVSNVLSGNGSFVALPTVSANANYANFAGTAFNVSGANVSGEVANANYASFAGTAYSVSGSNVVGEVSNANYSTYSGTASVANSVAGANVSGQVSYAAVANSVAGANVSGTVANATYADNAGNATVANSANSVAGANVTGAVAYATVANSVSVGNVSGIGNISTINIDGNLGNVLYGNGVFAAVVAPTSVANANYANFAGTAYSVSGSNVSGEVANAAYANIAGVANSVAGANVSGTVANATYADNAGNATIANSANSVAVANVVGIGNIATVNLDGSSSNVLYGNGAFATIAIPSGTSISNGTSNVNIPVANGNVNISTNNNANVAQFDTNGALFLYPTTSSLNAFRINSYGNPASGDVSRIASYRARGNATTPLSVQPNDNLMRLLAFGHNGTAAQTNSTASFRAAVDNSYTANGTNIPIGWNMSINDTNGGVNNQSKVHNFYANGNVVFANSLFAVDSFAVGGNITSNSGTFFGNGAGLTNIPAGNLSGNLTSLNVVDSANVTGTIQQLAPNTITISTSSVNNTAYDLTTIYGETSNVAESGQRAIIRSRGNVSTPATTVVSDVGARDRVYFYNGTTNALGFATSVVLSNLNSNSNAYSTGASYNISTGNPNGDQGNANAASGLNLMQFNQNGQLILLPGANSTVGSMLQLVSYGQPASLGTSQGITFSKARGNRDANLSVQPGDQVGRLTFQPHNGTGFVTNRLGFVRAVVDSSYVANTANIPVGLQLITCDNTVSYTHQFYANGVYAAPGAITMSSGNLTMGPSQTIEVNRINQTSSGAIAVYGPTTFNQGIQSDGATFTGNNDVTIQGSSNGTPKGVYVGDFASGNLNFNLYGNFSQSKGNVFLGTSNIFIYNAGNSLTLQGVADTANGKYANLNFDGYGTIGQNMSVGGNLSVGGSFNVANLSSENFTVGSYANANSYVANLWAETSVRGNVTLSGYNFFSNTYSPLKMQFGYGNVSLQILDGNIQVSNANGNGGYVSAVSFNGDVLNIGSGNAVIFANGYIQTNNEIDYLRTFGSFSSNVTQTNSGANAVNYMTLNNDEGSNGVSIVSSSQITVARTGRYNVQFSAQITHDTNATANIEIWLTKNGSSVANTNSRLTLAKDQPTVAAWNFVDNATTANTYYQIAWASPDTNMEILAYDAANTVANVAIPSIIVTVVPVGA